MNLLHIAGGVALMLFAVRFLRKGLERIFGRSLYAWIDHMNQRSWSAAAAGFAFGSVAPSSTAQSVLTMQLLGSGKRSADRMLVFLLCANVGITITVQLIAFRLIGYYTIFLLAGVIGYLWLRTEILRGIGQSLLAFGLVFVSMEIITASAGMLMHERDFQAAISLLANHRWLLMFFGAGLSFATQSSTATIGLVIALAVSGACTATTMIPVVFGANLGLGMTSLVVGWPTLAGRRLACANLFLKGLFLLPVMIFFPTVLGWVDAIPGGLARQAANVHTGFNLVVAFTGLAFAGLVGRLTAKLLPEPAEEIVNFSASATHLDPAALSLPEFALANAARETLQLTEEVKAMLAAAWRAYTERDRSLAKQVHKHDDRVDKVHAAIKHYLSQIQTDAMTPNNREFQFGLLHFASQLETVADVIDKSIVHQILKQIDHQLPVSPTDENALVELQRRVIRRFDLAMLVLTNRDRNTAESFIRNGEELKTWCIEAQRQHYEALAGSDLSEQEASTHFLDLLTSLRRISGQLNTIGHTILQGLPTPVV